MMNFWQAFCEQVERTPDAVALETWQSCEPIRISYRRLQQQALVLGQWLKASLEAETRLVGIRLPRGAQWIQAALACWSQGLCWVPVHDATPAACLEQLELILSESTWPSSEALSLCGGGLLPGYNPVHVSLTAPAYLIFTSGSSGQPKGALLPHQGLVPLLRAQIQAFGMTSPCRVLWVLAPTFDASISDWGTTLLSGSTLIIAGNPLERLTTFYKVVQQTRPDVMDLPPAFLNLVDPARLTGVKTLIVGGESPPLACVRRWCDRVRLINVYGPTEAMICTSLERCDAHWKPGSIGQPLPGVKYRIHEGELWIHAPGLALRYWQDEALTQARFQRLQGQRGRGQRWFRTGDAVRKAEAGYVFEGRLSRCFKFQGQFMAPEVQEKALQQLYEAATGHPLHICLQVISHPHHGNRLHGLVDVPVARFQAFFEALPPEVLQDRLWPTHWHCVNPWPLTPHHKTDVSRLKKELEQLLSSEPAPLRAIPPAPTPQNLSQTRPEHIRHLFAQVLQTPCTLDTDFFKAGGTSLHALQLVQALDITSEQLYAERTPRRLAHTSAARQDIAVQQDIPLRWSEAVSTSALATTASRADAILITGATGFLGRPLLEGILAELSGGIPERSETTVYALLRQPVHRLADLQARYPQLRLLAGDLSIPYLGLSPETYAHLQQRVHTVFHCAATVNHLLSYETLFEKDVQHLPFLFQLGTCFHYISSLSVLLSSTQGYARCKAVTEQLLKQYVRNLWVYRTCLLGPDVNSSQRLSQRWPQHYPLRAFVQHYEPDDTSAYAMYLIALNEAVAAILQLSRQTPGVYSLCSEPLRVRSTPRFLPLLVSHNETKTEIEPFASHMPFTATAELLKTYRKRLKTHARTL